jgi:hypothetical protein
MPLKKRLAEIILFDGECDIYLEIMSCEKQINNLVDYLSSKYFMKKLFVNTKDKK